MTTLLMLGIFTSPLWIFALILIFGKEPEMDWHEPEELPQPAPVAQNDHQPVSIQDAEALAFISSHPAMRFHRKTA